MKALGVTAGSELAIRRLVMVVALALVIAMVSAAIWIVAWRASPAGNAGHSPTIAATATPGYLPSLSSPLERQLQEPSYCGCTKQSTH